MNDVEAYGKLIEELVRKMTSPEMGQFRLEVSTFRIILEREKLTNPLLNRFSISETGATVNRMNDNEESLVALQLMLQRSLDFISSLVGQELAWDLTVNSMMEGLREMVVHVTESPRLLRHIPQPFNGVLKDMVSEGPFSTDHDEVLELFQDIFGSYMKDLSAQTDLSAFKLKLNILREKHRLLRYVEVKKNNTLSFEKDQWADASDDEVSEALVDAFDSLIGLSVFLIGKDEAFKKAARSLEYYFQGKEKLLKRYRIKEQIMNGALSGKVSTGIDELDERMRGGIPKGCSIVLTSPSGIDRDLFVARMMATGLNGGSSVIVVVSKDPPRSTRSLLRSHGVDPERMEEEGRLRIIDWFSWRKERIIGVERDGYTLRSSKILSNLGIAINKALRELTFTNSKMGIVHMVGPALNIFDVNQVHNFLQRLRAKFKEEEMASLFILEPETMDDNLGRRLLEVFDGQIELSKRMAGKGFVRDMAVKALSGSDFDATPLSFTVEDNRMKFGEKAPPGGPATSGISPLMTEERRKSIKLDVKRAPSELALQTFEEDAFETVEEDSWLKELLDGSPMEVVQFEPYIAKTAKRVREVMPQITGPVPGPVRPVVKTRTLKRAGGLRGGKVGQTPGAKAGGPISGPSNPMRPKVVRRPVVAKGPRSGRPDTAELMDEIDITGTDNSPQRILLDAIETLDQLLMESERSVPRAPRSSSGLRKKMP